MGVLGHKGKAAVFFTYNLMVIDCCSLSFYLVIRILLTIFLTFIILIPAGNVNEVCYDMYYLDDISLFRHIDEDAYSPVYTTHQLPWRIV